MIKTLPRTGGKLLVDAGEENAGLVDLGDGLATSFKIESHNHPSAVEPYEGAATGVGGNVRDVCCMGAEVIATTDSFRFGDIQSNKTKWIHDGVVDGIGGYGNPLGIPNIGGDLSLIHI